MLLLMPCTHGGRWSAIAVAVAPAQDVGAAQREAGATEWAERLRVAVNQQGRRVSSGYFTRRCGHSMMTCVCAACWRAAVSTFCRLTGQSRKKASLASQKNSLALKGPPSALAHTGP